MSKLSATGKKPPSNKKIPTDKTDKKTPVSKNPAASKKNRVEKKQPASTKGKAARKKTAAKGQPPSAHNKIKSSKGWLKKLWSLGWKLALVVLAILVFIGIYLDSVVKQRFEGQLFDLPAVVYGRVLTLSPDEPIALQQVRNELDVLNYRKVRRPDQAGEYSASSTRIELIRRPFEFETGPEPDRHVMLTFTKSGLHSIFSLETNQYMGFLRLEPKMLGMLEKNHDEQRLFVRRGDFPEVLIDALLTTEDRNYYQHDGVSPLAIARAMVANIKAGRTVQGGSTLTQQLAKNLFLSREKTLWRKLREAYIALILNYRYSKDRVLEAYLNEVYLGQNAGEAIHGFGLASRYYFGQPIQELRIDQIALLVGMVKGPSYYNPIRYPERSQTRRDLVLKMMMQQGLLNANQYEQAVSRPLDIQKHPKIASRQPAYFQQLKIELKQKLAKQWNSSVGLRVFTTLDPVSQQKMQQAIMKKVPQLAKRGGADLEAAAIAVDRHSGEIRAMVGGKRVGYSGFNRVLNARRPIGSLVKPALYLTALSHPDQYTLLTTLHDTPLSLKGSKGTIWTPRNFDRKYRGDVPLYQALAHSLNVPTVRLGLALGIPQVSHTLVKLGIPEQEIRPVPAMFLGAFSLTPYQVAQMYQTITNSGRKAPLTALRSVLDLDGNVLYQSLPKAAQVVPQQAAWLTTYAMKKGVQEGTGRYLQGRFSRYALAGKTGTSNDSRDSWFVGVDGKEVTTVWVGRDSNQPTKLTGASGALRIYDEYLHQRIAEKLTLPWPKGITMLGVKSTSSGALALSCGATTQWPVWDVGGKLKHQCDNQPAAWIKSWFN